VIQEKPQPGEIRDSLERVLASSTFARSDRARKLLQYLIDQQLAGQADRLKGFSIAVDVFGKDADYDSSTDAIVRVQAGRLRELLDQYYAGEGANDAIRISIPRGNYIPAYLEADQESVASETALAVEPTADLHKASPRISRPHGLAHYVTRQLRMFWVAFAVLFALLGFVAWNSWRDTNFQVMSANAAPATRVADAAVSLPHVFLRFAQDEAARRTGAVMRTALTGFDTIVYIARDMPNTGDAAALDFAFDLGPGPTPGSVNVSFVNLRSGEVIASRLLPAEAITDQAIDNTVADVITSTLPVSGALYSYLESKGLQRGITKCLLLDDDYYLDQTAQKHRAAYDCFDNMLAAGAYSPMIYSEMAALQLEAVTDKYGYPPDASMDKGLQLARRAVQMAPNSPYAHRAYGFLYTRMGMTSEALKWTKKAYELGRYDFNMAAAYGYALTMAGHYADGTAVMQRAVTNSSARPSWWDYTLFLGYYMTGDLDKAAEAADSLTATQRPHYLAARLLAAEHRKQAANVESMRLELLEKQSNFVENPRAFYERADYPTDMINKLTKGLAEAGVAAAS
jgi:tetratricopeptide (TPR) repeat protein